MQRSIRTGRQPSTSSTSSTKSSKSKSKSKQSTITTSTSTNSNTSKKIIKSKLSNNNNQNNNLPLDIYSYSSSIKKPRGDVDPESRPTTSTLKNKNKNKGKGKGKAKAKNSDEEEEEDSNEEDSSEEEEDEDKFLMGSDGIVEFTGIKPSGLYMGGMSDNDDEGKEFNSEDDEEILSDDAFEDEDDLPIKSKKSKAGKKLSKVDLLKESEIDLDEEEIDFDDEEGGAYMDASEMLDTGEFDSNDSEVESGIEFEQAEDVDDDDDDEIDSDEEDEDEDEEMDSDDSSAEEDEEYQGALIKLSSFVDGLESKKRRMEDDTEEGGKKKKRVVLKERTEAFPEGEFVAVSAPEGIAENKVNLEDLISSFANSKNPRLAALRKTLKPLASLSETSSKTSTSKSHSHLKTSGPLAAPLPARLQDKIEREAAYEKTKEETDKWNETVRRMKGESGLGVEGARKERLTLPLMGGAGDVKRDPNAAEWNAKFKSTNSLESSVEALLASARMSTNDLQKAEKQALAALDPADVAARQLELRQQRDLMFRAERKAKRVAKIKSKAFRRIHRRAKGKGEEIGLTIEEMMELDKIDGGDRVVEEKARMEIVRARERATLKHSTRGGRWSKTVGGIEGLDEERNTAVRDMVARGDELRRKIAGIESDDDNDEFASDGSSEEDEENATLNQIRQTAFDELASLDKKSIELIKNQPQVKGVLNMKFMKDAIIRGERKLQTSTDELRRKLTMMDEMGSGGGSDGEEEDDSMGLESEDSPMGMKETVQGNLGRLVFGPSSTSHSASPLSQISPPIINKPIEFSTKLSAPLSIISSSSSRTLPIISTRSPLSISNTTSDNPWLTIGEEESSSNSTGKISRKMNKAVVGKDSKEAIRSAAKVDRHKSKMLEVREIEKEDALVEIDPSIVLTKTKVGPQINVPKKNQNKNKKVGVVVVEGNSKLTMEIDRIDSSDEDDEVDHEVQRGKGPTAFKQRDLVAAAFAGDNVVADFEAEKRRETERDAPSEIDNTLPGWGAWSGKGVKKAKNPKKFITKVAGIEPTSRQDANYSNVIISEKRDKKASKYMLKDLPFPYTSAAQHDHKLRMPLGPEWSTSTILRDQTIPKVLIKPGVTIRPLNARMV